MRSIRYSNFTIYEDGKVVNNYSKAMPKFSKIRNKVIIKDHTGVVKTLDRVIYEGFNNTKINTSQMVHHIDGNELNCTLDNLQLKPRKGVRRVRDIDTGIIYYSCFDASKHLFVTGDAIYKHCIKKIPNKKGGINVEFVDE